MVFRMLLLIDSNRVAQRRYWRNSRSYLLILWLSFFCRSLASACISASVSNKGSGLICNSGILVRLPDWLSFKLSPREFASNDNMSSKRSSACNRTKKENQTWLKRSHGPSTFFNDKSISYRGYRRNKYCSYIRETKKMKRDNKIISSIIIVIASILFNINIHFSFIRYIRCIYILYSAST